jgi:hypothetical protein
MHYTSEQSHENSIKFQIHSQFLSQDCHLITVYFILVVGRNALRFLKLFPLNNKEPHRMSSSVPGKIRLRISTNK